MTDRVGAGEVTDRRRRIGTILAIAGGVVILVVLAGRAAAVFVGTELAADTERVWSGERWYVVAGDDPATCRLRLDDGAVRSYDLGLPSRQETEWDLGASSDYLTPGGFFVPAESGAGGALSCGVDVRVTTGWATLPFAPTEGGLWVFAPAAAALVGGRFLRRTS